MEFPNTADEVTTAWLTQSLRLGGLLSQSSSVSAVEIAPLAAGYGQTSDTVRLILTLTSPLEEIHPGVISVIAKFATPDDVRRTASANSGLYRREIDFYRMLAPQIRTRVPAHYYSQIDSAGEYFVLILEDLSDFVSGDDVVGCSVAQAELGVRAMAAIHGAFLDGRGNAQIEKLTLPPIKVFADGWDRMAENFGDNIPAEISDCREAFLNKIEALDAYMTSGRTTVLHGDFKLDNLMFDEIDDPHEIVVLDWQNPRLGRGIHDFAYLLTHSMNTEIRRKNEHSLLNLYATCMQQVDPHYSAAVAAEEYRHAMLYLWIYVIFISGVNLNSNVRARRRKTNMISRASSAILDWQALDLLTDTTHNRAKELSQ